MTEPTETARALLWRHQLPEDVIDGVLALHAQELAGKIRARFDGSIIDDVREQDAELISPEHWARAEAPAVSAGVAPATDQAALRDRIAEALWPLTDWDGDQLNAERAADAVLAVLPAPADRAHAEAPAATCSAQNRNYESGPRLCIRAAQHRGDHIDERGFHWSDTVAVYPLADGTFRTGINVRAALRRVAAESAPADTGHVVAYRSPGTRQLYCVTCARQETGWQPVTEARNDAVCDFCGAQVHAIASQTLGAVIARHADAEQAEDPARIDRLRPEFTEHASVESIDTQLQRARAQERRWHLRVEWLISLRQARVTQKARGEWPAAAQQPKEA